MQSFGLYNIIINIYVLSNSGIFKTCSYVKFIYYEKATFLRSLHRRFVQCSNGQIYGGDFVNFFGLLRIYELYEQFSFFTILMHNMIFCKWNSTIILTVNFLYFMVKDFCNLKLYWRNLRDFESSNFLIATLLTTPFCKNQYNQNT